MLIEVSKRGKFTKIIQVYPEGKEWDDEGKRVLMGIEKGNDKGSINMSIYAFEFKDWSEDKAKSWVEGKGFKKFVIVDKKDVDVETKQCNLWMEKIEAKEVDNEVVITGAFYPYYRDRDGDIIETEVLMRSWEREYKYNPVVLYMHNRWDTDIPGRGQPIGKVVKVWTVEEWMGKKFEQPVLVGELRITDQEVVNLILEDKVRALSIGFIANEFEVVEIDGKKVVKYTDIDWLETSVVDIPSNRYSIFEVNKMLKDWKENWKAVPRNPEGGMNDTDDWQFTAEDGNKILDRGGWKLYAECHAWYDGNAEVGDSGYPEVKSAYKLPHHKIDTDGKLKVFWSGVKAAMGALLGARGGVDIPDDERSNVYRHLVGHYEEFGKEPPEFKMEESMTEEQEKVLEKDVEEQPAEDTKENKEQVVEEKEQEKVEDKVEDKVEEKEEVGIETILKQMAELSSFSDKFTNILVEKDAKINELEEKVKDLEAQLSAAKEKEQKDEVVEKLKEELREKEEKIKEAELKARIEKEVAKKVEERLKDIINGLSGTRKTVIRVDDGLTDGDKKAIEFLNRKIRGGE